jgi:hypothetical protein
MVSSNIYIIYNPQEIILADGVVAFCEDLAVDPSDVVMLVISWRMGARHMGE